MDVDYLFIESSKETIDCLRGNIEASEYRDVLARIQFINDAFVNQVDAIIRHVKNRARGNRAIFVLDQFGYTDVPFSSIQSILSQLENAEIILTFATDSLINYLSGREAMQKTLETLGLRLNKEEIASAKQEVEWRRTIQFLLHQEIFTKSGAKHYTPFFIRSKDSNRDYWLIHLSNHSKARDVMVGLHWRENTSFAHFGRPGLQMLGYDQDLDIKITSQPFLFDQSADELTRKSLLEQLPERIHPWKDGISFSELFSRLTNEMPATSDILKSAIGIMVREGLIEAHSEDGLTRREVGIQANTDVIKPSMQRRFILPE